MVAAQHPTGFERCASKVREKQRGGCWAAAVPFPMSGALVIVLAD